MLEFRQLSAHSLSTKKCEIITAKWFKRKPTFWEISIGLNFTLLTRKDEKYDFDLENGGSTYT